MIEVSAALRALAERGSWVHAPSTSAEAVGANDAIILSELERFLGPRGES